MLQFLRSLATSKSCEGESRSSSMQDLIWLSIDAQKLHHDRSVWHCFQYHGVAPFHSQHAGLLYSGWTSWDGLGLVFGQHVHLHCWAGNGRSGKRNANFWWTVLVSITLESIWPPTLTRLGGHTTFLRPPRGTSYHSLLATAILSASSAESAQSTMASPSCC